jgi:hypothetical protein
MRIINRIIESFRIGYKVFNSTPGSILYIDDNNKIAEDNANLNYDDSGKNVGIGISVPTSSLHLPTDSDSATPTLAIGDDGDSGFYEKFDDVIGLSCGGVERINFGGNYIRITGGKSLAGPQYAFNLDTNTGMTRDGADELLLVAGGKEGQRLTETTSGNDSLQHILSGQLGQATGDEIAYSFNYTVNKATSGDSYGPIITLTDTASPGTNTLFGTRISATFYFAIRETSTSGDTWLMIYDVDNGTMERVSVGAADSGGAGYKVLRIPN